jgi:hypothetical protein
MTESSNTTIIGWSKPNASLSHPLTMSRAAVLGEHRRVSDTVTNFVITLALLDDGRYFFGSEAEPFARTTGNIPFPVSYESASR